MNWTVACDLLQEIWWECLLEWQIWKILTSEKQKWKSNDNLVPRLHRLIFLSSSSFFSSPSFSASHVVPPEHLYLSVLLKHILTSQHCPEEFQLNLDLASLCSVSLLASCKLVYKPVFSLEHDLFSCQNLSAEESSTLYMSALNDQEPMFSNTCMLFSRPFSSQTMYFTL